MLAKCLSLLRRRLAALAASCAGVLTFWLALDAPPLVAVWRALSRSHTSSPSVSEETSLNSPEWGILNCRFPACRLSFASTTLRWLIIDRRVPPDTRGVADTEPEEDRRNPPDTRNPRPGLRDPPTVTPRSASAVSLSVPSDRFSPKEVPSGCRIRFALARVAAGRPDKRIFERSTVRVVDTGLSRATRCGAGLGPDRSSILTKDASGAAPPSTSFDIAKEEVASKISWSKTKPSPETSRDPSSDSAPSTSDPFGDSPCAPAIVNNL